MEIIYFSNKISWFVRKKLRRGLKSVNYKISSHRMSTYVKENLTLVGCSGSEPLTWACDVRSCLVSCKTENCCMMRKLTKLTGRLKKAIKKFMRPRTEEKNFLSAFLTRFLQWHVQVGTILFYPKKVTPDTVGQVKDRVVRNVFEMHSARINCYHKWNAAR